MGIYTPSRETSDPSAPAAGFGSIYLKGASDAAIKAYFEKPSGAVLELANTTDANSWAGAQTFSAGAVIAASQALTGTVANSTISGFLSVTATTFTGNLTGNVTGNVSGTAPAGSLTGTTLAAGVTASSLTSLGTIASLVAGTGSFSDTITSTKLGIVLSAISATTQIKYTDIRNTGGTLSTGVENSSGASVTGLTAYAGFTGTTGATVYQLF